VDLFSLESFWENPKTIPQIVPDSEEAGTNKLADSRRNASLLQTVKDKIVQDKISERYDHIPDCHLGLVTFKRPVVEGPVALKAKVDRPANEIANYRCPP
jgi:hypothetical protein